MNYSLHPCAIIPFYAHTISYQKDILNTNKLAKYVDGKNAVTEEMDWLIKPKMVSQFAWKGGLGSLNNYVIIVGIE